MSKNETLKELKKLEKNTKALSSYPNSKTFINWVAKIKVYSKQANPILAKRLEILLYYASLGLSSYGMVSLTSQVRSMLKEMILQLESELESENSEGIKGEYSSGEQYDFYTDIKKLIKLAKKEILYVDPYLNQEMLELCFDRISGVNIRILTSQTDKKINSIVTMLGENRGLKAELRTTNKIHDRYLFTDDRLWAMGQSIKDGASKKPTYIVELNSKVLKQEHEGIWASSKSNH